jgi:hypothetical protein
VPAIVQTPLLFRRLLDDAAIFPPGNAPMLRAVSQHVALASAWYAATVGPFVCTDQRWPELVAALPAHRVAPLDVSIVVLDGIAGLARAVADASLEPRVALRALELRTADAPSAVRALDRLCLDVPTYLELPTCADLGPLQGTRHRAKFRTGGESLPTSGQLAMAIVEAVTRDVPFKLTAGLHHAVAAGAQHGFVNVLLAVARALDGEPVEAVAAVLADDDAERLTAGVRRLGVAQRRQVRRLFVSFGTCSLDEPLADLLRLGLLAR